MSERIVPSARRLHRHRSPDDFTIIGHRGASAYAPENTTASFDLALDLGATALELDVRETRDGHLVVWHDRSLDRIARIGGQVRSGRISKTSLAEIGSCEIGSWFNEANPSLGCSEYRRLRALTLAEAVERYGARAELFVEIKGSRSSPTLPGRIADLLRAASAGSQRHRVMAFDTRLLKSIHAIAPRIELVQLMRSPGALRRGRAIRRYALAVSPFHRFTDVRLVAAAHAHGLAVYPYTVNDEAEMAQLGALGVDGLITDRPDVLQEVVSRTAVGAAAS